MSDVRNDPPSLSLTGEFGSVMEGHLRQPDGTSEKVAVKTMKCEIFWGVSKMKIINFSVY